MEINFFKEIGDMIFNVCFDTVIVLNILMRRERYMNMGFAIFIWRFNYLEQKFV